MTSSFSRFTVVTTQTFIKKLTYDFLTVSSIVNILFFYCCTGIVFGLFPPPLPTFFLNLVFFFILSRMGD